MAELDPNPFEGEQPDASEEAAQPPRWRKPWLWVTLATVLVLGLGGGLIWYLGVFSGEEAAEASTRQASSSPKAGKGAVPKVSDVLQLDPVVVNLRAGSRLKYARVGIALGLESDQPAQEVVDSAVLVPKIKDFLVFTFSQMTSDELLEAETKQQVKKAVQDFVNRALPEGKGRVVEVYLTEFIVQ